MDAGAAWIYPRSPQEVVPAGVRAIAVRVAKIGRHVTTRRAIATILRWIDALPIVPPGVHVMCPLILARPELMLDFRSGSGVLLAHASAPSVGPSGLCDPVTFSIRGRPQRALIGKNFAAHVERRLGIGVS